MSQRPFGVLVLGGGGAVLHGQEVVPVPDRLDGDEQQVQGE